MADRFELVNCPYFCDDLICECIIAQPFCNYPTRNMLNYRHMQFLPFQDSQSAIEMLHLAREKRTTFWAYHLTILRSK